MNRRRILQIVGLGLTTTLAGCAASGADDSDKESTPTEPKEPVPGNAKVGNIQDITDSTIELSIYTPSIHREVTLELIRYTPSADDLGQWKLYTVKDQTRPILTFKSEGTSVSQTTVDYEGSPSGGFVELDFPADREPTGCPLIYGVRLIEHTLSNQSRLLGYTPLLVRRPDTGQFEYQEASGGWHARNFGYDDLYEYTSEHSADEKTITVTSTSTESRWNVPRHDDVANRHATTSQYKRAWYERPWSLQYTIADDECNEWMDANKYDYIGHTADPGMDFRNLRRIYLNYFQRDDTLARVAEAFNETAERAGLVTPLEKLRFICDFVQWMPYTDDKSLPQTKPRVKTPTVTLYELTGDCEDKVCLVAGLLYQDALPDYKLGAYYVKDPGHVGVAVRKDIFDVDVDSVGNHDDYLYAEVTYPAPLGMVADDWSTPTIRSPAPKGHPSPQHSR